MPDPQPAAPTNPMTGEEAEAFLDRLDQEAETESWNKMASQVPPALFEAFLERHPVPKRIVQGPLDQNEFRQNKAKKGEDPGPAFNEGEIEVVPAPGRDLEGKPVEAAPPAGGGSGSDGAAVQTAAEGA